MVGWIFAAMRQMDNAGRIDHELFSRE